MIVLITIDSAFYFTVNVDFISRFSRNETLRAENVSRCFVSAFNEVTNFARVFTYRYSHCRQLAAGRASILTSQNDFTLIGPFF